MCVRTWDTHHHMLCDAPECSLRLAYTGLSKIVEKVANDLTRIIKIRSESLYLGPFLLGSFWGEDRSFWGEFVRY